MQTVRSASVARVILILTILATLALASAGTARASGHEFDPASYSASGTGTTSANAHNTGVRFHYNASGFSGSWSFTATADQDGPLTFDWAYSYLHSWFRVNANLTVFANGPSGTTSTTLVNQAGGGEHLFVGTTTIQLHAGYTYGFNVSGSNFDSSRILTGNVYIFPDTDVTAPVVTPTVTGTLGNNGWYTSDVQVSWSIVENDTLAYSQVGCGTQTLTTDTAGTTYTCTATSFGGTTVSSVTIMRDTTAPVISVSGATTVPASEPDGAYIDVNVSAADLDPAPVIVCDPTLDSLFAVGETRVTCTATDAAGNQSTSEFTVRVIGDVELLNALKSQVLASMPPSYYRTQLVSYVDQALLWESKGNNQRAAMHMDQLIDRVSMYRGTVLSVELADDLIAQAEQIKAALGYGSDTSTKAASR